MKSLLLIGTGKMAKYYSEYIKNNEEVAITAFNPNNRSKSALNFSEETGVDVIDNISMSYHYAIVCCSWDKVITYQNCSFVSEKILLEKLNSCVNIHRIIKFPYPSYILSSATTVLLDDDHCPINS